MSHLSVLLPPEGDGADGVDHGDDRDDAEVRHLQPPGGGVDEATPRLEFVSTEVVVVVRF